LAIVEVMHFIFVKGKRSGTMSTLKQLFAHSDHDRDCIYRAAFRQRVGEMGIREVLTAPRSPWQNPYAERFIGSLRRECLDHIIVFRESSLRRILRALRLLRTLTDTSGVRERRARNESNLFSRGWYRGRATQVGGLHPTT
jgi:transposase InsO family protein